MLGSPPSVQDAPPGIFDYGALPASVQKAVREQTESIHGFLAKSSANVVQIGLRLQFVRDRLGRAHFQPWLKAEFAWKQPTASNYMRAAKTFGDLDCIAKFQPGALFVLARQKVPVAARVEAIRLAQKGDRVTRAVAIEIINRHTLEADRAPVHINRLRKLLLNMLPKLSSSDMRQVAEELKCLVRHVETVAAHGKPG